MKRVFGRPSIPLVHKDFQAEVPTWNYILECGHTARYVLRVEWMEHGWCSSCRQPFVYDWSVEEVHPQHGNRETERDRVEAVPLPGTMLPGEVLPPAKKKRRKKINVNELSIIQDQAILRNRVADMLWVLEADTVSRTDAKFIGNTLGCSWQLAYSVAERMGLKVTAT